jgi:hypothetical protein
MEDNEKVDFGPLDPSTEQAHWQTLVLETARRAREKRQRALTVSVQLVAWGPTAIASAASLALVVWAGSWLLQKQTTERGRAAVLTEQAAQLSRWAANDELPPPEVLLEVMGDDHGHR